MLALAGRRVDLLVRFLCFHCCLIIAATRYGAFSLAYHAILSFRAMKDMSFIDYLAQNTYYRHVATTLIYLPGVRIEKCAP